MIILSFESSCDETAVAIVEVSEKKYKILSNKIASQVDIHAKYGGVVPEIASRAHIEAIKPLFDFAMTESKIKLSDIELVTVANRPGLIGALLVGVSFAKSLAYSLKVPCISVNHIMGHICSAYFADETLKPPFIVLVVSGGHTSLIFVENYQKIETIGRTRDDAAGEAFDKVGRLLGFPYPGGAEMDKASTLGKPIIKFPLPLAGDALDFSFSGLKTSAVNLIHNYEQKGETVPINDIAASFTKVAVDGLMDRLFSAIRQKNTDTAVIVGGVSANSHLRETAQILGKRKGIKIVFPPKHLCGDNACMHAIAGYFAYQNDSIGAPLSLNAYATGRIESEQM